ncbi:uncharacterized protein KY384_006932 [Bacidia gigantensis]|uniref:uncharacterized protein n=1 Tax=Bacidia gigantensis TaxID=2732470 RepID=UPI001D052E0D|nr:uncharacterized protein KY384_006932 [Bacidia gigantensis]KAG8528016.1 hypothetical protein KY384_006932 [Bacidia gigantensis]
MASRIKRLLHRDQRGSSPSNRRSHDDERDFQTVPYGSTSEGLLPSSPDSIHDQDRASFDRKRLQATDRIHDRERLLSDPSIQPHPYAGQPADLPARKPVSKVYVEGNNRQSGVSTIKVVKSAPSPTDLPFRPSRKPATQSDATTTVVDPTIGAQKVIDRAKSSSNETHVTTSIAPAVTHETVHREMRHVREERITREVHNHEIYHRVQPIIDVEVLPTRHFLPMGNGELLEVSGDDVPGREKAWVIAETASKIATDDPKPTKPPQFTARTFANGEGDDQRYITSKGYERTEQTWIHPPNYSTQT